MGLHHSHETRLPQDQCILLLVQEGAGACQGCEGCCKKVLHQVRFRQGTDQVVLTGSQRSWINCMLRMNLGDAKVANFIEARGLPRLLDMPLRSNGGAECPDARQLMAGSGLLDELMMPVPVPVCLSTCVCGDSILGGFQG